MVNVARTEAPLFGDNFTVDDVATATGRSPIELGRGLRRGISCPCAGDLRHRAVIHASVAAQHPPPLRHRIGGVHGPQKQPVEHPSEGDAMPEFVEPAEGDRGDDEQQVVLLAGGVLASHSLHMVADLGIADMFGDGSRTVDDLAAAIPANSHTLQSVLRLLASHGIFEETSPGAFALSARGRLLRTDHPRSMRSIVRLYGFSSPVVLQAEHSLRTGRPAFDEVFGESFFDYMKTHPTEAMLFNDAMADLSRYEGKAIVNSYDFAPFRRIVDVGGGDATLLAAVLVANSQTNGVLFDQPQVAVRAEQTRDRAELGDRLQITGGDFFVEVPADGDLYILKSVLHDWPDDQATVILRTCRKAMAPEGRLVVFERILTPDNAAATLANTVNLAVELLLNGRERTQEDYRALFANSGFSLGDVLDVGSGVFAVEAIPV
jgi:hypothetical protein